jgi:chromosome transmission fidelity protein 4
LGENACFLGARSHDGRQAPEAPPDDDNDGDEENGKKKAEKALAEAKRPSVVVWRPHVSATWAGNSEWTVRLPIGEEAEVVAIGGNWGAVATSMQWIRIFSYSGMQRYIFSLPGPVVTMVGSGAVLAIVYHAGAPHFGSQNLAVMLMDIDSRRRLHEGPLPVCSSLLLL